VPDSIIKSDKPSHIKGYCEYDWPIIARKKFRWGKQEFEIEPREQDSIVCEFIIPVSVQTVVLHSHLNNVVKPGLSWCLSSTYDISCDW